MGVLSKIYTYLKNNYLCIMPKEKRTVDRSIIYDPSQKKDIRMPWFDKDQVAIDNITTVKRGGALKKVVTSSLDKYRLLGKKNVDKSISVKKFDKSGKLKKETIISDETGITKKVVNKPGKESKNRNVGIVDKLRLKKV
jgi:hypothetical protein